MRNTLAFLAAAVLVIAGLGWYLDWYKIGSSPGDSGHREVNIDINAKKVTADVKRGAEAGAEELQGVLKKQEGTNPRPQAGTNESGKSITISPQIIIKPGETPPSPPSSQQ